MEVLEDHKQWGSQSDWRRRKKMAICREDIDKRLRGAERPALRLYNYASSTELSFGVLML